MGSTGKAGVGVGSGSATQPEKKGLQPGASQKEIQSYYKDTLGIEVGGSYFRDKNDPELLVATAKELDFLEQEFGKGFLQSMGIRIRSKSLASNVLAQTYSNETGYIDVNKKIFDSAEHAYDEYEASIVLDKFHPDGSTAADIIVHEVGHQMEIAISKKIGVGKFMWPYHLTAENLVKSAYNELPQGTYSSLKQARSDISKYADSTKHGTIAWGETFAEGIADYVANRDKAKPLSKEIWKKAVEILKDK